MTEKSSTEHKDLMPFIIFRNHLEMMGRMVESSCKLSHTMLAASRKSAEKAFAATDEEPAATSDAPSFPAMSDLIPSTEDLQTAASAVATAMNEAAVRAIAHASGTRDEDDDNDAPIPAQPKKVYKPSISAAKKATSRSTSRAAARK